MMAFGTARTHAWLLVFSLLAVDPAVGYSQRAQPDPQAGQQTSPSGPIPSIRPSGTERALERADSPNGSAGPHALQNQQPAFMVRATVNHATHDYTEGDTFSLSARSEVDAYLYVFFQQADGRVFLIFPNKYQPDNRVAAKKDVQIPAEDDLFRWRISPPFGRERLTVIAAKKPLTELRDPALWRERFNPVPTERIKGLSWEIRREEPAAWAEHDIEIRTHAAARNQDPVRPKRLAALFGVSNYEFSKVHEAATGKELNLHSPAKDATILGEVLEKVGRLDEIRVYPNEKASRQRMQEAITEWLPSVSRPGDTVLIYFSGHGARIPDDNGDETDKLDEVIFPFDQMTPDVVNELLKRKKEGKLEDAVAQRLDAVLLKAKEVHDRTGSNEEALASIIRQTGVTDDEFGLWLQKLDGRQVIVIIDSCFAGGFAQGEKGNPPADPTGEFDFLDRECARLKDLGQSETALLTACATSETSLMQPTGDFSVMTYYLIERLTRPDRPAEIVGCFEHCAARMKAYFSSAEFCAVNDELRKRKRDPLVPHEPRLYNLCSSPAYLAP
jgi:hypothetical protein